MSPETLQPTSYQARRKKYVDTSIQGRLIGALLILEVLIVALAMWFVYQELQTAIDNNLYRVHQPDTENSPVLLAALMQIIPWIVIINLLMLVGIDRLWGNYLLKIIEPLRQTIKRVRHLDLRKDTGSHENHAVLESAQHWTEQERERCRKIRRLIQSLPEQIRASESTNSVSDVITEIKQLLP